MLTMVNHSRIWIARGRCKVGWKARWNSGSWGDGGRCQGWYTLGGLAGWREKIPECRSAKGSEDIWDGTQICIW